MIRLIPSYRFGFLGALLVVALSAAMRPVSAQEIPVRRAFDEGTRSLAAGDFRGAVEAYERAEALGLASAALYYNRGVAHYRLDEIGRSVQYLERAYRLADDRTRIRHSLEIVSARREDSFSELPVPIWKKLQRAVFDSISNEILMIMGISTYLLLCTALLVNILGYWRGPWFQRARLAGFLVSGVLLLSAFSSSIWPAYPPEAVVLVDETSLHESPDPASRTTEDIHEGLVVGIVTEAEEWMLVQLPNGLRGWLPSDHVGTIQVY